MGVKEIFRAGASFFFCLVFWPLLTSMVDDKKLDKINRDTRFETFNALLENAVINEPRLFTRGSVGMKINI